MFTWHQIWAGSIPTLAWHTISSHVNNLQNCNESYRLSFSEWNSDLKEIELKTLVKQELLVLKPNTNATSLSFPSWNLISSRRKPLKIYFEVRTYMKWYNLRITLNDTAGTMQSKASQGEGKANKGNTKESNGVSLFRESVRNFFKQ